MRIAGLLLMLATALGPPFARAEQGDDADAALRVAVVVGAHDWGSLGRLEAADGDDFGSTGINIAIAAHLKLAEFRRSELLAGGELGFLWNEASFTGAGGNMSARTMYLLPSVKLAFGARRNLHLDAGAGLYLAKLGQFDCSDSGCAETNELWEETRFGGYLGLSADSLFGPDMALTLEAKAHFVQFGSFDGLGGAAQSLGGPIYMLQIGVLF